MEMNRYLIAALYVMAGCAVTIPLKTQANGEPLRGERCRLVITNTVKVISVYLDEETRDDDFCGLSPENVPFFRSDSGKLDLKFHQTVRINAGPLCHTFHKIRAPETRN